MLHSFSLSYKGIIGGAVLLGALCVVADMVAANLYNKASMFEQAEEKSWSTLFMSTTTNWIIMITSILAWLLWRFFNISIRAPAGKKGLKAERSALPPLDPRWSGPSSQDFFNAPCQQAGLLDVQGREIPWTISTPDYNHNDRSYTISPFSHYIGYALDAIDKRCETKPLRGLIAKTIAHMLGLVVRLAGIDECIYFNNWLISTCLWPNNIEWSPDQVDDINEALLEATESSKKAIVWRCVDTLSQPALTKALENSSCLLIPCRVVNWIDYGDESVFKQKHNLKDDLKLFRKRVGWDIKLQKHVEGKNKPVYEVALFDHTNITMDVATQAVDLYSKLNVEKYSKRSPQLTPQGVFRLVRSRFFKLDVLRLRSDPSRLVAVAGWTCLDGVITNPLGGYDTDATLGEKGMYRLAITLCVNETVRTGTKKQHLSGGANRFKRHRGATSTVEYMAVFTDHLPLYQRLLWMGLKVFADKIICVERAS